MASEEGRQHVRHILVETHVPNEEIDALMIGAREQGWRAIAAQATPKTCGFSGGVLILSRPKVNIAPLETLGGDQTPHHGDGWAAGVWRLKGLSVVIMRAYMQTSENLKGPTHVRKVSSIGKAITALRMPFFLAATGRAHRRS